MLRDFCSGNKKDNITIIYTPWSNLKKDGSMAVGQVSFHSDKKVCYSSGIKKLGLFLTSLPGQEGSGA